MTTFALLVLAALVTFNLIVTYALVRSGNSARSGARASTSLGVGMATPGTILSEVNGVTLDQQPVSVSFEGTRTLVAAFSTTCASCIQHFPDFRQIATRWLTTQSSVPRKVVVVFRSDPSSVAATFGDEIATIQRRNPAEVELVMPASQHDADFAQDLELTAVPVYGFVNQASSVIRTFGSIWEVEEAVDTF